MSKAIFVFRIILFCLFFQVVIPVSADTNEISFDFFTQKNGLPNNQIQCIYQDRRGWMWFGTSQGLSRFDGYRFVNFPHSSNDEKGLKGNIVRVIMEDEQGNMLVGTEGGGLNVFNRNNETFSHPFESNPDLKGKSLSVNDIQQDGHGNLWLGTNSNILMMDSLGIIRTITLQNEVEHKQVFGDFVRVIQFDNSGKLWAGTNKGLYVLDPLNNAVEHIKLPFVNGGSDEIWEIFLDNDGSIWIGTYGSGVFIVDPITRAIKTLNLEPVHNRTETVRSIALGVYGNYWIGTRGGLYVYHKEKGFIAYYRHDERELTSLINNSVLDIFHDQRGEIWIGTRGGLNLMAKSKQVFHNYKAHPSDKNNKYMNSGIVYAFWMDHDKNIWIGTEDGGVNIYHPEKLTYSYLVADESNPNTVSIDCIKAFQDDGKGNLWIGTFLGGIDVLDLETKKIKHYKHNVDVAGSLSDNKVWDFLLDANGDMWVGTSAGIDRFDPISEQFVHYAQLAGGKQVNWIDMDSHQNIWMGTPDEIIIYYPESKRIIRHNERSRHFKEDSEGRCWVTTLDRGFAEYSPTKGALRYYTQLDGLVNDQALCILEDDDKNLWISTSNGLSKFNPKTEVFHNFSSEDGLLNNQFSYGAAYKLPSGELLFGGNSGFNIFNPSDVKVEDNSEPLILTDFRVLSKKVTIGTDSKAILKKSISETKQLTLKYDQNVFALEFAALNYVNSESNLYRYYLEGFDKNWSEPSTNRTATYTNLNPNDYILHVSRVIPGLTSDGDDLQLRITVLPPYWKTVWFRILIFLVIVVLIYYLIQFFIYREKVKNELLIERLKARKLHDLDMLKLKFFTNISHEIRTPLTLILAPLEKLTTQKLPEKELASHLDIMYRNTKHLDRLISQLLDFRKLETGNLKLKLLSGDIIGFISEIVRSFEGYADEKEITIKFNTLKKRLIARFDADKIEKIMNNLLTNAFKFTGKGGKISVNISLIFRGNEDDGSTENQDHEFIEISVRDNGQGISHKNASKIFNRFFQANEEEVQTGAGIGLSFVKELVKLHKGKIFVESKPGRGSKFTFQIPYLQDTPEIAPSAVSDSSTKVIAVSTPHKSQVETENLNYKIMLIVEDNPDVRTLIKSHFASSYQILEAGNGKEGLTLAVDQIPDVIISDVLMPDVDGFEFCKKVKKDERTSHIPLLLLTALHSKEHELKGLTSGADDYITKPFDLSILKTKIDNMLSIRDSLKEKYSGEMTLQPKNIVIASPDEKFLQKAVAVVEKNIEDSELDIERFCQEIGVSRMQLYRKLHALTDMTVKEFIRSIRLKRAAQLLLQDNLGVSEIAYAVGFKDLSHFRKCFRQMYGMNATEYKRKK